MTRFVAALAVILPCFCTAQNAVTANRKLSLAELHAIATSCAPNVDFDTLRSLAKTESSYHVAAISLNRPQEAARRSGWMNHRVELLRQPTSVQEAIQWMHWFQHRGYTVSVGLMQVNIESAPHLGVTPERLFDPCTNLAAGATLLSQKYAEEVKIHGKSDHALLDAISSYNAGSITLGYSNGYVDTVLKNNEVSRK